MKRHEVSNTTNTITLYTIIIIFTVNLLLKFISELMNALDQKMKLLAT